MASQPCYPRFQAAKTRYAAQFQPDPLLPAKQPAFPWLNRRRTVHLSVETWICFASGWLEKEMTFAFFG
jgi:hypothetical protein